MSTKIFDIKGPGLSFVSDTKADYTYVIIGAEHSSYFGEAPILGIKITQSVDYTISKFMSGNFGLVTFQDKPVLINISGIVPVRSGPCTKNKGFSFGLATKSIQDLYNQHRASNLSCTPLYLTIGNTAYKAFITGLTQQGSSKGTPGVFDYSLSLVGVRIAGVVR